METVARELLSSPERLPWSRLLEAVGSALGASRVYVALNRPQADETTRLTLRSEWCAPGVDPFDLQSNTPAHFLDEECARWREVLAAEGLVHAAAQDLPEPESRRLGSRGASSVLVLPLATSERFAGFVAAEHRQSPSPWSGQDIDFLRAFCCIAGEAIAVHQEERSAQDVVELTRAVISASADSYYLLDDQGVVLAANVTGARRLGVSVKELVGRQIGSLLPSHVDDTRRRIFEKVLRTGRPARFTDRRENLFLDNTLYPVLDRAGHVRRVVVSSHDVTHIKRAEQAIEESEHRYRTLFESSPVKIVLRDASNRIVDANPAAVKRLGFAREDLIGSTPLKYQQSTETDLASRTQAVLDGSVLDYETVYVRPNGSSFHVHVQESCVPLPDGSLGVLTLANDISRRKHDEEIIRKSEMKYRIFFEAAADAMFLVEQDTLRIVEANNAACSLYGYTRDELVGMTCDMLSAEPEATRRAFSQATTFVPVRKHRKRDGTVFPVEISLSRYSEGGQNAVSAIIRDQTEKVYAAEETAKSAARLQQLQKLRSLNVMAGGVAHDFNNILHVVIGYTELAMAQMAQDTASRNYVERSNKAARQAAELSNLMLAYVGQGKMEYAIVDLNSLIQKMKPTLDSLLSRLAEVKYDLALYLPPLKADPNQLTQVVLGLTTNASESLQGEPGRVTISTRLMHCDREYLSQTYLDERLPEGEYVCLEVADTGSGMDHDTLSRVFEPFFSTKFTGRGLGLAAVLGIVRGHAGAIRVCSTLGEGTSFQVVLPPADASNTGARAAEE